MDIITIIGLVLGWGSLWLALHLDGGHIGAFIKESSFILIFGGTMGVTFVGYTIKDLKKIPPVLKIAFVNKPINFQAVIQMILDFAVKSRREGVLALEDSIAELKDDFTKKGFQLLVDGLDYEHVRHIMEAEFATIKQYFGLGEEFLKKAGGFSPTIGVIGTVMGLVEMLKKLDDPGAMGPAIAAAFIATFYGVAFANLIYLPLANKISNVSKKMLLEKRIILEGILAIQAGESPRNIKEKLDAFLVQGEKFVEKKEDKK